MLRLGHPQLDRYLEFVSARARPNTTLATGYDLKVFFSVVAKDPVEVTHGDVLDFITAQRGDRSVVRMVDGESGLSARTIQRRLSSISGLYGLLGGMRRGRVEPGAAWAVEPETVADRARHAAGPHTTDVAEDPWSRPRSMSCLERVGVGGIGRWSKRWCSAALRRVEVLGLRLEDLKFGERRVFIAEGKGGHQRIVPVSARFFDSVANYLDARATEEGVDGSGVRGVEGPEHRQTVVGEGAGSVDRVGP